MSKRLPPPKKNGQFRRRKKGRPGGPAIAPDPSTDH
jgi:hypothetical protein